MDRRVIKASKFMAYVLRHDPDSVGLVLDESGWVDLSDLIDCAGRAGVGLSRDLIDAVLTSGDKQRFSLSDDGRRMRANYGHSLPIENLEPGVPPPVLFHGTEPVPRRGPHVELEPRRPKNPRGRCYSSHSDIDQLRPATEFWTADRYVYSPARSILKTTNRNLTT